MSTSYTQTIRHIGNSIPLPLNSKDFRTIRMNFLEGERGFTENELRDNEITRYQVTKFYQEQIRNSGYYEQLKHIVEPSLKEFYSPGDLDTSGEGSNTVVTGIQHECQTGLLLTTDRSTSYCRYCFRKRIVGKNSEEVAPNFEDIAEYIRKHPEMNNVLLSGGDPFVLRTEKLNRMLDHLLPIPNLTSIRFGPKRLLSIHQGLQIQSSRRCLTG